MVTISDSTLNANVWKTVYDLIVAANLESSTTTVTSAFIDNHTSFPQVVINPIEVSRSDGTIDSTMTSHTKEISVIIDLYSKKASQIDTMNDSISTLLMTTNIPGITLIAADSSGGQGIDPNGNKIHVLSLTFTYKRR